MKRSTRRRISGAVERFHSAAAAHPASSERCSGVAPGPISASARSNVSAASAKAPRA